MLSGDVVRVVYKYTIEFGISTAVEMPKSAKFLKARMTAFCDIELWYEIDRRACCVKGSRVFAIHPTGREIPHDGTYLDTVFGGVTETVWHIFDCGWSEDAQ